MGNRWQYKHYGIKPNSQNDSQSSLAFKQLLAQTRPNNVHKSTQGDQGQRHPVGKSVYISTKDNKD